MINGTWIKDGNSRCWTCQCTKESINLFESWGLIDCLSLINLIPEMSVLKSPKRLNIHCISVLVYLETCFRPDIIWFVVPKFFIKTFLNSRVIKFKDSAQVRNCPVTLLPVTVVNTIIEFFSGLCYNRRSSVRLRRFLLQDFFFS